MGKYFVSIVLFALGLSTLAAATRAAATDNGTKLDEIIVTAALRSTSVADLPQSVTVLNADTLRGAGVQHFEDVLGMVPNLNWAAGTSRPRFFQLRGVGEFEQYQGAPNPSVGFLIDDIDFSGVGMPATLFDTQQVEVLRGPQGTAYGANALAGLISVRTVDPGDDFELKSEITAADYGTRAVGLAVGDRFSGRSDHAGGGWRLVAQKYSSDGFRRNAYLKSNSANGFDEGTLRGKLRWQINGGMHADLTLMHVNLDNGYDAWSINNTYTTYSNQPGRDAQRSDGAALRVAGTIDGIGELRSVTSTANSKILYSFDGDWGNDLLWGPNAPYDYFQRDDRTRRTLAEDLRMIGNSSRPLFGRIRWLAGIYVLRLSESDQLSYSYRDQFVGAGSSVLSSKYSAINAALYASLDADLGPRASLTGGLRLEHREAQYADSADVQSPFPNETNHLVGGNLSWQFRADDGERVYVTLARGYKGGGFNIGSQILAEQRSFAPEALWSIETGLKVSPAGDALGLQADLFYMRRQNMQGYLSQQLQSNNPLAFVFYTQNAGDGENYGVEGEAVYRPGSRWQISGSGALLRTRYLGVRGLFASLGLDGRAQPFAPGYKLSAAVEYRHPVGWFARLDANAIDGFYYSASDAQTSKAYTLENARAGYARGAWTASLWVRNIFDARYAQQGFYFGLIPPNFPKQSFVQLGDPRQVGFSLSYASSPESR